MGGDLFVKELAYQEGAYASSKDERDSVLFTESCSITVLIQHTSTSEAVLKAFIHDHSSADVSNKFDITDDGWYEIVHLVIPTTAWLEDNENLDGYETIYVTDGSEVYKYENGELTEIDITEVYDDESLASSSTWMVKKDVFVLYNLWQCYLNYCRKMLESECSQDSGCPECDNELTKNMRLIWIFLNAIQYLVKLGEFQRAQEFLEEISGCNTLCSNEMFSKTYDCGCGK